METQTMATKIKRLVDRLMGKRAGDGLGPTGAAAVVNQQLDVNLTPREVWNIWISN